MEGNMFNERDYEKGNINFPTKIEDETYLEETSKTIWHELKRSYFHEKNIFLPTFSIGKVEGIYASYQQGPHLGNGIITFDNSLVILYKSIKHERTGFEGFIRLLKDILIRQMVHQCEQIERVKDNISSTKNIGPYKYDVRHFKRICRSLTGPLGLTTTCHHLDLNEKSLHCWPYCWRSQDYYYGIIDPREFMKEFTIRFPSHLNYYVLTLLREVRAKIEMERIIK